MNKDSKVDEIKKEVRALKHFWEVFLKENKPFLILSVATQIELTIKHLKRLPSE